MIWLVFKQLLKFANKHKGKLLLYHNKFETVLTTVFKMHLVNGLVGLNFVLSLWSESSGYNYNFNIICEYSTTILGNFMYEEATLRMFCCCFCAFAQKVVL